MAAEVVVVIGGRAFPIHPLDFSWDGISDGDRCIGGFQANDGVTSGDYLFGDTAMRVRPVPNLRTKHAPISALTVLRN